MKNNMMVSSLINANGNATANQFVIDYLENGKYHRAFQSYSSRVCDIEFNKGKMTVKFGCDWDYSRTTMKHLAEFLRQNDCKALDSANSIRKAIKNGFNGNITVIYDETMR